MIPQSLSPHRLALVVCLLHGIAGFPECRADRPEDLPGKSYSARDSLGNITDPLPDAMQCLNGLCWQAEDFTVQCEAGQSDGVTLTVRYPSPKPIGQPQSDQAALEWYAVVNSAGEIQKAPAVVVIHESGSGMNVGRLVSKGLRERGVHALMLQLPFYGLRRPAGQKPENQNLGHLLAQGVADGRRALDTVQVLPGIDTQNISLLGISLGGFVSATCAGLDGKFHQVFILLAGGNLPKLIATGDRETAQLRERLQAQGYTGDKLLELLNTVEPNRLAHRINSKTLWVYAATMDTVVPPEHCESFAKAAGIDDSHHIRMPANHYTGILFLPGILNQIVEAIHSPK